MMPYALRELVDDLGAWRTRTVTSVQRASAGPVLVRFGVFLMAAFALAVAWPRPIVFGPGSLGLLPVSLLPMAWPRGRVVTGTILLAVVGWLLATTSYQEPVAYWRLVLLAAALYLLHTLAALASVLPYDAVLSAGVLSAWLRRAGVVVLLTAAVGLFVVVVPERLGDRRYLLASLVGVALIVTLAAYLASLARRRVRK